MADFQDPLDPTVDLIPCTREACTQIRAVLDRTRVRNKALESGENLPRHILFTLALAQSAFEQDDYTGLGTIEEHIQPVVDTAIGRINQIRNAAEKKRGELWATVQELTAQVDQLTIARERVARLIPVVEDGPVEQDIAAYVAKLIRERDLWREQATRVSEAGLAHLQKIADIQAEVRDLIKASPERAYVPQDIAAEMLVLLNRAGLGRGSHGNTLMGMTAEAVDLLTELQATIDNERGAGTGPSPEWAWYSGGHVDPTRVEVCSTQRQWKNGGATVGPALAHPPGLPWWWGVQTSNTCNWTQDPQGFAETARAGMKLADAARTPTPTPAPPTPNP